MGRRGRGAQTFSDDVDTTLMFHGRMSEQQAQDVRRLVAGSFERQADRVGILGGGVCLAAAALLRFGVPDPHR